jgi:hypothetical protein
MKTHCKHNHELTPENVYTNPSGVQFCRTCRRLHRLNNSYKYLPNKRKRYIEVRYGISYDDYMKLSERQMNLCAICGEPETMIGNNGKTKRLAVDHCHTSGKVRGLLCGACNRGLGYFKDNPELLENAIRYVKR